MRKRWVVLGSVISALLVMNCRHLQRPELNRRTQNFEHHMNVPPSQADLSGADSGILLYENHCQFCHGPISNSTKSGRSKATIAAALESVPEMQAIRLSDQEIGSIAVALSRPRSSELFSCETQGSMPAVTPDVIRPLSKTEYINTLNDLFGSYNVLNELSLDFSGIPTIQNKVDPFDNVKITLSDGHLFSYSVIAGKLGDSLTKQSQFVRDAFGGQDSCLGLADLSPSCLQSLAANFGARIMRRPLDTQDLARASKLIGPDATGKEEAEMILYSWLMSSDFIYHLYASGTKVASDARLIELSPYELASRLSYALWSSMPDAELFRLAANGTLKNDSVFSAQIDRIMADPKARQSNGHFYVQWLQLKNQNGFNLPEPLLGGLNLDDAFKADITTEAIDFVNHVTFEAQGGYADLFTSPLAFPKSSTYRTILNGAKAEERPGLLWRLILASSNFSSHRNLIHSGAIMRERILCEPVPPPSPQLVGAVNAATMLNLVDLSSRQEVAQKTDPASCSLCHSKINPLSFASANRFDSVGRFINEERRLQTDGTYRTFKIDSNVSDPAVDNAGESSLDGPYALAASIAKSKKGRACLVRKRLTYIMGRPALPESKYDGCALKRAYGVLEKSEPDQLQNMVKALLGPEFKYRRWPSP